MVNEKFYANAGFSPEELKEDMLSGASQVKASDIHIDPGADEYTIRFRVDGVLSVWLKRSMDEYDNLVSFFKVASNVDITEHNVPQDGHFLWFPGSNGELQEQSGDSIDVRTSFFPVIRGQAIVLRLLNRADFLIDMKDLFTDPREFKLVSDMIHRPHGMILVTGPANAGKTTTLYSILKELATDQRNIVTLEDPVEFYMTNIRQSQIREEVNYTLTTGLRSILRQDPDITMIGEIRDYDTAENALRASLSGRLFFSTIHANDSVSTINRLLDMELKKDLVAYALSMIIAQRLVRKICENCKTAYTPDPEVLEILGMDASENYFKGQGCEVCLQTGFKGRIRLSEILTVDQDIQRMILVGAAPPDIKAKAVEKGFRTLRQDGVEKIRQGITTPEEVLSVTA